MRNTLPLLATILAALPLSAGPMDVLVNGAPTMRYVSNGVTYIEAIKGREYEIRLTNPYGVRVAVALSVDGLNTLDAKHTDARSARKWVLGPYESITLRGWQTSSQQSRRFFFTSEEHSYGQWLGQTDNLGVISAAFFRERRPPAVFEDGNRLDLQGGVGGAARDRKSAPSASNAPAQAPAQTEMRKQDDLAATGIGRVEDHPVSLVHMELEDTPAMVTSVRYEYRSALIALGVIPAPQPVNDALQRREKAHAFVDNGYCPTPR